MNVQFAIFSGFIYPALMIAETLFVASAYYIFAIRWASKEHLKASRTIFLLGSTILATCKTFLYWSALRQPFTAYTYLSELISYLHMLLTILTIAGSFHDFCTLHCFVYTTNGIMTIMPQVFIEAPLMEKEAAYQAFYSELAAKGQVASATQIISGVGITLAILMLDLLLIYIQIRCLDWAFHKVRLWSSTQYNLFCIFSFLLYFAIRISSAVETIRANGKPSISILVYFLLVILAFILLLMLNQLFRLEESRLQVRSQSYLLALQKEEIKQMENNKTIALNYLENVELQLQILENDIRKGMTNPPSADFNARILPRYADNPVADTALGWCDKLCQSHQIEFTISGNLPREVGLNSNDETSVYYNLLKNAFEGAVSAPAAPYIHIDFRMSAGNLLIKVTNNYDPVSHQPKRNALGLLISWKVNSAQHGYGTKILRHIAEINGGSYTIDFDEEKAEATAIMLLPMKEKI